MNQKTYDSSSIEQTIFLAKSIADKFKGGEVIELISDLGGGKTTFVRGLLSSIDPSAEVFSPSFTICNEYHTKNFNIYHFDFYRLNEAGIIQKELEEVLRDTKAIVIIEWSDIVSDVLPANRVKIKFRVVSEDSRQLSVSYPDEYKYLFNED